MGLEGKTSEGRLLTKKEVCYIFRISMATLDRRIKEGIAPFNLAIKMGRLVRFPPEILEYIKNQVKDCPAQKPKLNILS
jgi:predicted DNA-binding transcriptional regulator AlpA